MPLSLKGASPELDPGTQMMGCLRMLVMAERLEASVKGVKMPIREKKLLLHTPRAQSPRAKPDIIGTVTG